MLSNGTGREDLGRLALMVAEEFDKALRGDAPNRAVIDEFATSLAGGRHAPLSTGSVFLHNHRTIGAFGRAWQRTYHSRVETVEDLNARVSEKIEEAGHLLGQPVEADEQEKAAMKRFFLSLHRELLIQQFPPRRIRRPSLNEELMHG